MWCYCVFQGVIWGGGAPEKLTRALGVFSIVVFLGTSMGLMLLLVVQTSYALTYAEIHQMMP